MQAYWMRPQPQSAVHGPLDVAADVVFCMDATGSMRDFIAYTKNLATKFFPYIKRGLQENHRNLRQFRIRFLAFRDFYEQKDQKDKENPPPAIEESEWFVLSDANGRENSQASKDFFDKLSEVKAKGGGDPEENALEAFVLAMRSDFTNDGGNTRHIIIIATDEAAHPLQGDWGDKPAPKARTPLPDNLPHNMKTLQEMWENGGYGANHKPDKSRLLILAPREKEPWERVSNFMRAAMYNSVAGQGMRDSGAGQGFENIIQELLNRLLASLTDPAPHPQQ